MVIPFILFEPCLPCSPCAVSAMQFSPERRMFDSLQQRGKGTRKTKVVVARKGDVASAKAANRAGRAGKSREDGGKRDREENRRDVEEFLHHRKPTKWCTRKILFSITAVFLLHTTATHYIIHGIGVDPLGSPVDNVAEMLSSPEPSLLAALRQETLSNIASLRPDAERLLLGPTLGRLLHDIIAFSGASRVLETLLRLLQLSELSSIRISMIVLSTDKVMMSRSEPSRDKGDVVTVKGSEAAKEFVEKWDASERRNLPLLITVDPNSRALEIAKKYLAQTDVNALCVEGEGQELIDAIATARTASSVQGEERSRRRFTFDMVFVDAEKRAYGDYFQRVLDTKIVRKGGLLVFDNAMGHRLLRATDPLHGNGTTSVSDGKAQTRQRHERIASSLTSFHYLLRGDPRVDVNMLGIRDGLAIARRV